MVTSLCQSVPVKSFSSKSYQHTCVDPEKDESGSAERRVLSLCPSSLRGGTKRKRDAAPRRLCCSRARCGSIQGRNRLLSAVFTSDPGVQNDTGPPQTPAGMEPHGRDDLKGPVLNIVVVGFHHKKGCQVREPLLHASTANQPFLFDWFLKAHFRVVSA